jgi:hypothetical protein
MFDGLMFHNRGAHVCVVIDLTAGVSAVEAIHQNTRAATTAPAPGVSSEEAISSSTARVPPRSHNAPQPL